MFEIFLDFFGNFCGNFLDFSWIFLEDFFWRIFLRGFFGRIFLGGFFWEDFWEEFFGYIGIDLFVKILVFVKILSQDRRKEGEFLIIRSAMTDPVE